MSSPYLPPGCEELYEDAIEGNGPDPGEVDEDEAYERGRFEEEMGW